MIRKIDHKKMGKSELGWLTSLFHFSFAQYYNPDNMNFGALRVINDDLVMPHTGFDTHPHRDMEIVTYVVEGKLTHGDSMRNKNTLGRGDIQYMSAGTGVLHSEMNDSDNMLRFLQIWIMPNRTGYTPQYGDLSLPWEDRQDKWLQIISGETGDAPIKIHQDMNIFVSFITEGNTLDFDVKPGRQAYMVAIEGKIDVNGEILEERDAAEIVSEKIRVNAFKNSHVILLEMKKDPEKV